LGTRPLSLLYPVSGLAWIPFFFFLYPLPSLLELNRKQKHLPLSISPGLSAAIGLPSPPLSKCAQILCRNSFSFSTLSSLKHGCLDAVGSFGTGELEDMWICCPFGVISNL
jgi:hypothetical protein